jgi:hypothetical protein
MSDILEVKLSIKELLEFKRQELWRKSIKEVYANFHIYIDGEHYKSFRSYRHLNDHLKTKKFFKKAFDREVKCFYSRNI